MSKAAFLVQGTHLRSPVNIVGQYDLLVCNASLPIAKVREKAKSGAIVLAYFGSHMIEDGGPNSVFFNGLRTVMKRHYLTLHDGEVARDRYGNYELDLTFAAFDDYAGWINGNLDGYDGVYLDECWGMAPEHWTARTRRNRAETVKRWPRLMEYWIDRLWLDAVGNVGHFPGMAPEGLVGITIEKAHIDDMGAARAVAEFANRRRRDHNVAWGHDMEAEGLVMSGDKLPT